MKLTIDIPDAMQAPLELQFGRDLALAAKQALAVAWYEADRLSIGQVAEFLGISLYEAEGAMKAHHVDAPYSVEDLEHDRATLARVLKL